MALNICNTVAVFYINRRREEQKVEGEQRSHAGIRLALLRSFGNIENAAWKQFLWLCGTRVNWKRT
jgi:hypothetical protein